MTAIRHELPLLYRIARVLPFKSIRNGGWSCCQGGGKLATERALCQPIWKHAC
ncbi:uncharacterized protein LY79DRAFT_571465 [Colletotrichum navitas]|uniref:Uncharacterized protein n=1 Tax=Colletotrichum navitas TaxID=681940 RepID=A0AAD8UZC7_9PEZI|nr:uncharacterized protein LY79DRAFT_571465 [Colletotrichum navitas]KAK1569674.1 hypothetical protein LY79DRAFT_571465 [Colletotrichum navitas]